MDKKQIYEYIKNKQIWYEITEHKAVYSMSEISEVEIPYPESDAKNLFVRDDKKENYYLITVRGNKRVNLKEFRKENNTRPLSFESEKELEEIIQILPGSVSPLGILNDKKNKVKVFLDKEFIEKTDIIGIHPNDNTATIWLKTKDLIDIIKENGNKVELVEIKEVN